MNPRTYIATVGLAALAAFVFTAAPAQANYGIVSSFGSFVNPQDVTVDRATGDVYVIDIGATPQAVYKFDAAGNPVDFSALGTNALTGQAGSPDETPQGGFSFFEGAPATAEVAVDSSAGPTHGDIYVADMLHQVVDIFGSDGKYLGQLTGPVGGVGENLGDPCGVAVDSIGNVYVAKYAGHIYKFTPHVNPVADKDYVSTLQAETCNVEVDAAGNVYAKTNGYNGSEVEYAASQFGVESPVSILIDPNSVPGAAVDPTNDDVYVDEESKIAKYDPTPSLLEMFGSEGYPALGQSYSVAVGPTGTVYASDTATGKVDIFGVGSPPTQAKTDAATNVTGTSVTLAGELNPGGVDTRYYFAYNLGATCTGGSRTPVVDAGSGSVLVSESTVVENLQPDEQYAFCFVAVNPFGAASGATSPFTTSAISPTIDGESSTLYGSTGPTTVTITARVNPDNQDTRYYFQYGVSTSYGSDTPALPGTDIGSAYGDQYLEATITGLMGSVTYHYRVVAINASGTSYGTDQTFTTSPPRPTVVTERAREVTQSTASLSGTVNPEGLPTTYYYQYGISTEYATTTVAGQAGEGTSPIPTPTILGDLVPDTTYHYRLVAENADGTTYGQDQQFMTTSYPAPSAITEPPTGVTPNGAVLNGTIDPGGVFARYEFELGGDATYGIQVFGNAGTGAESETVTLNLANLLPATTYHYRVCAINQTSTTCGADVSFTTPGILAPLLQPPSLPFLALPEIVFPKETGVTTPRGLTNGQKLANALKACSKKPKSKRLACEKAARKKYSTGGAKAKREIKKR
jgi:hypothetical protein